MDTKPFSLQSPEQIAKDYGGNKQKIAQAAQMGMLDPTAAVLAGMFIDRMRGAQMEEQGAPQTVAEDVFMPQQPQMGMGAAPGMGGMPPEMGMAPPMQQPMPQAMGAPTQAGLDALPVPNEMFAGPGMAGGGLVAFAKAGEVDRQRAEDEERRRRETRLTPGQRDRLALLKPIAAAGDVLGSPISGLMNVFEGARIPFTDSTVPSISMTPFYDMIRRREAGEDTTEPDEVTLDEDVVEAVEPEVQAPPPRAPSAPGATQPATPEAIKAEESALDRYTRMLLEGMQDRDVSREEAKNMALLQAGLGIMGGTSPYALQNIAQGALPATQAYQQQMAQQRKEERETIGELANIEVKAKELGLTEQRYKDLMQIAGMQIAASGASDSMRLRSDIVKLAIEAVKTGAALGQTVSLPEAMQQATMAVTGQVPAGASGNEEVTLEQLRERNRRR